VEYGFRLPSALDNRPLTFEESQSRFNQVVYVSATPANFEMRMAGDAVVELIVRPTGLIDPVMEVRSARHQVDDLHDEIRKRQQRRERVLVTTLTKRMAEDLTEYYSDLGLKVRYLHSDITTLERMDIIRDLRLGHFDVLVGINLLREGLDIPRCRWCYPGRRQGRVSAIGPIAHSDLRSCCAQRQRHGHPLRRHRHALDAASHRRNQPPPHYSAGPQPGTRNHAGIRPQGHHRDL